MNFALKYAWDLMIFMTRWFKKIVGDALKKNSKHNNGGTGTRNKPKNGLEAN